MKKFILWIVVIIVAVAGICFGLYQAFRPTHTVIGPTTFYIYDEDYNIVTDYDSSRNLLAGKRYTYNVNSEFTVFVRQNKNDLANNFTYTVEGVAHKFFDLSQEQIESVITVNKYKKSFTVGTFAKVDLLSMLKEIHKGKSVSLASADIDASALLFTIFVKPEFFNVEYRINVSFSNVIVTLPPSIIF